MQSIPVGAGLPAKRTPRWMAPASPVFAGKPRSHRDSLPQNTVTRHKKATSPPAAILVAFQATACQTTGHLLRQLTAPCRWQPCSRQVRSTRHRCWSRRSGR
ncbi:hypothetical protein EGT09_11360 [Pseudomonas putida]|nr:hypothetical protein EGT09_11360 [Pseudomonas putida]